MIKELAPLENPKKDFSHLMDDLINKEEVNTMILNNIKNKRLSLIPRNSNESNNNFTSNSNINVSNNNILKPNNRDSRGNIPSCRDNIIKNPNIKLTKANDFNGEIRENKNNMIVDSEASQPGRTQRSTQNTNLHQNSAKGKQPSGSILDFIKRSSESFESAQDISDDKIFDGVGLDRIEEESEEIFQSNNRINKTNGVNGNDLKKRKNFMIDEKNKNIKKKNKLK